MADVQCTSIRPSAARAEGALQVAERIHQGREGRTQRAGLQAGGRREREIERARPHAAGFEAVLPRRAREASEEQRLPDRHPAGASAQVELATEQAVTDDVDLPAI